MKQKLWTGVLALLLFGILFTSYNGSVSANQSITTKKTITQKKDTQKKSTPKKKTKKNKQKKLPEMTEVSEGTSYYRGFLVDNVYHSKKNGDIHYNVYVPKSYDGTKKYALYITLPGYQGLYFQGVAENIKTEDFGFEAQKYNSKMIIVAPQLNDWGETSANQTIDLTEYLLSHYNLDKKKVYINGYSGGGETLSLVLGKKPELFAAALMGSSQWDGAYQPVVDDKTPVYFVIGENDEYYGSQPFRNAYQRTVWIV